jgi:hypothetical protein
MIDQVELTQQWCQVRKSQNSMLRTLKDSCKAVASHRFKLDIGHDAMEVEKAGGGTQKLVF